MSKNWQQSEVVIVIKDKLQGNVATHLNCVGIFSDNFSANLLLSLLLEEFLKSVNV